MHLMSQRTATHNYWYYNESMPQGAEKGLAIGWSEKKRKSQIGTNNTTPFIDITVSQDERPKECCFQQTKRTHYK